MVRILELFSGYGTSSFAIKRLGINYELVGYSDIDKWANLCFKHNHCPHDHHNKLRLGDITKINPNNIENFDLLTGGFPCSPKGTLIKTEKGYKKIEDITTNDYVLTHTNSFKKVKTTMNRNSNHINIIKAVGVYDLKLTDEHPVYTYNEGFKWVEVKNLKEDDFLVFNINNKSENPHNLTENECWLLGRYCADGSFEKEPCNRLYFSIGKAKRKIFEEHIKDYQYFICHEERNCQEIFVKDERLETFCRFFNNSSKNKKIPQEIIDLPIPLLKYFLEGYISGDGFIQTDIRERKMFTTVSEKLVLGLQECFIKAERRVCSIGKRIDNRKETYNDSYNGQICKNNRDSLVIEDKILVRIKEINRIEEKIRVYNIEVDKDNSYTCNNVIVHNCQPFSTSGNMQGEADTRGTLFYDIIRIAEVKKPKYMLLENVKGLTTKPFEFTFLKILSEIRRIGYNVYYKVLNSKDFGVPQNRERIWFVCIRKDIDVPFKFQFPTPIPLTIFLKDILEKEVDKKYYVGERMRKKLSIYVEEKNKLVGENESAILDTYNQKILTDGTCITISVGLSHNNLKLIEKTKELDRIGDFYGQTTRGGIYNEEGIAPTITKAMGDEGGYIPMIKNTKEQAEKTRDMEKAIDYATKKAEKEEVPSQLDLFHLLNGEMQPLTTYVPEDSNVHRCLQAGVPREVLVFSNKEKEETIGITNSIPREQKWHMEASPCLVSRDYKDPKIIFKNNNIRRLTPRECFRLMGFFNDEIILDGLSDTQIYRLAGNGQDVNMVSLILKNILIFEEEEQK